MEIRARSKARRCVEICEEDLSKLSLCIVNCLMGSRINESSLWIQELRRVEEEVYQQYGVSKVTYSKEFRSFIENPLLHLSKKLFIYTHDYARGRLSKEEYASKVLMALNTSLRTNMRLTYQNWFILALLLNLRRELFTIVYPEHGVLNLERSGKQKLRWIPPNVILGSPVYGDLSLFIEAPRPIAWGDSTDLSKTWGLYVALRPDMLVYSGRVYDIVDLNSSPPIRKPDVIIEVKELPDWYRRAREVKGPLAKPLSAEEWRSRWIDGLWSGLSEVLGVPYREVIEKASAKRGLRVLETKIVELYYAVYSPKELILVSKHAVPSDVKNMLEAHNITVYDDVSFSIDKVGGIAEKLIGYAKTTGEYVIRTRDRELASLLEEIKGLWEKGVLNRGLIKKLIENLNSYATSST